MAAAAAAGAPALSTEQITELRRVLHPLLRAHQARPQTASAVRPTRRVDQAAA